MRETTITGIDLSIVTVNFNGLSDTLELIVSLKKHIATSYEIIVVDNGSKENEAFTIQQAHPDIVVIRSEKNLGFAGGNNLGIAQARGKYLLFINNDTYVLQAGVELLIARMEKDSSIGGISPMIRFAQAPHNIQFAGYTPLSTVTLRNRLIGFGEQPDATHRMEKTTPYLHGAAMLIRREAIEKAGMMPEIYFLYYEELDWSERIREKGYHLLYLPSWCVYHKESQSTGAFSPLKSFYFSRNRMLYAWRNCGMMEKYLSIAYQTCLVIPRDLLRALLKGHLDHGKAIIKGVLAFYFNQ